MGMSHELCNHPRTPAGRAACRKAGGPGAQAAPMASDFISGEETRKMLANVTPAPLKRIVQRTPGNRTPGDVKRILADLPRVFRTVVDWANTNDCQVFGWEMRDQRMVDVVNANGRLTLTWRPTTPDGVHAVAFRPAGTSVAKKLTSVNEGLALLRS